MAIQNIGTTISGIASDTKPTLTANEKGVIFIETDTNKIFQWDTDSWNQIITSTDVAVGALDSGSITSNFGTIDTGSSTITTTGLISGGSLDIDDVLINGTTIGHTNDTDLITVADGLVTIAGEISTTTLDIGGTNVTSTAAEINLLDALDRGSILYGNASGATTVLGQGGADTVLTSDGTDIAWQDAAAGGGTATLNNFGKIPAGAPVALYNDGTSTAKAVVISGQGHDVSPRETAAIIQQGDTLENHKILFVPGQGTGGAAAMVKFANNSDGGSTSLMSVGTITDGGKTITWGDEIALSIYTRQFDMVWDVTASRLILWYVDYADSNKGKVLVYKLAANTLDGGTGDPGAALVLPNEAMKTSSPQLAYDSNDGVVIAAYAVNADSGFFCHVLTTTGSTTNTIANTFGTEASAAGHTAYAVNMVWKGDRGLLVYQNNADSSYNWAMGVIHDDSSAFTFGTKTELWGTNVTMYINNLQTGISVDTSNDNFVLAGCHTDADGDFMPAVVSIKVAADASILVGDMLLPYPAWTGLSAWPTYYNTNMANESVMHELNGRFVSIHYDPDRDAHFLHWRAYHYSRMYDEEGGLFQVGHMTASNVITIAGTNDLVASAGTTRFYPRRNLTFMEVPHGGNSGGGWFGYSAGASLTYDTTNNVMFSCVDIRTIRRAFEGSSHSDDISRWAVFPWLGNTTADGGNATLTYAPSNVGSMIGFNTTNITDTGIGATATITTAGALNENQTGLTVGAKYYLTDSGILTTSRPMFSWNFMRAAVATAATKIIVIADSTTTG